MVLESQSLPEKNQEFLGYPRVYLAALASGPAPPELMHCQIGIRARWTGG